MLSIVIISKSIAAAFEITSPYHIRVDNRLCVCDDSQPASKSTAGCAIESEIIASLVYHRCSDQVNRCSHHIFEQERQMNIHAATVIGHSAAISHHITAAFVIVQPLPHCL